MSPSPLTNPLASGPLDRLPSREEKLSSEPPLGWQLVLSVKTPPPVQGVLHSKNPRGTLTWASMENHKISYGTRGNTRGRIKPMNGYVPQSFYPSTIQSHHKVAAEIYTFSYEFLTRVSNRIIADIIGGSRDRFHSRA